jgi:hypothetical protein
VPPGHSLKILTTGCCVKSGSLFGWFESMTGHAPQHSCPCPPLHPRWALFVLSPNKVLMQSNPTWFRRGLYSLGLFGSLPHTQIGVSPLKGQSSCVRSCLGRLPPQKYSKLVTMDNHASRHVRIYLDLHGPALTDSPIFEKQKTLQLVFRVYPV